VKKYANQWFFEGSRRGAGSSPNVLGRGSSRVAHDRPKDILDISDLQLCTLGWMLVRFAALGLVTVEWGCR